jgi:hypothetical protein
MQRINAVKALRKEMSREEREGQLSVEDGAEAPLLGGGGSSNGGSARSSGLTLHCGNCIHARL